MNSLLLAMTAASAFALSDAARPTLEAEIAATPIARAADTGAPLLAHGPYYRSYRYYPRPYYRPAPVIVGPPVHVRPYPVYPQVYHHHYCPSGGFRYSGPGVGISIGW